MGTFFTVGAVEDPPALLLTAADDLDLRTVAQVRQELVAATDSEVNPVVVIDVTGRFVGARGVGELVGAITRARDAGHVCVVAGLPPVVLSRLAVFDAEGLPLFGSLADAVGGLPHGRDVEAGG